MKSLIKKVLCLAALPSWTSAIIAVRMVKEHPWKIGNNFRYGLQEWAEGRSAITDTYDVVMWFAMAVGGLLVFHFRF